MRIGIIVCVALLSLCAGTPASSAQVVKCPATANTRVIPLQPPPPKWWRPPDFGHNWPVHGAAIRVDRDLAVLDCYYPMLYGNYPFKNAGKPLEGAVPASLARDPSDYYYYQGLRRTFVALEITMSVWSSANCKVRSDFKSFLCYGKNLSELQYYFGEKPPSFAADIAAQAGNAARRADYEACTLKCAASAGTCSLGAHSSGEHQACEKELSICKQSCGSP